MAPPDAWVTLLIAVLSGGGMKYLYDAWAAWRASPPREIRLSSVTDANIATVARARDELSEDVTRLREMLADERAARVADDMRHSAERARWLLDQERLRTDVARLEDQIRAERISAVKHYDALLAQVVHLGTRTDEMGETHG